MMPDTPKTKAVRVFTVLLLVAVVVGGLVLAWPTYLKNRALKAEIVALDAEIADKRSQIADLKDKQRRFKTDRDFVESIARQNRRVYPGELVFIFDENEKKK